MGLFSFFTKKENKERLDQGLEKTKQGLFSRIHKLVLGKSSIDEDVLDELEEALISGDVGVETTLKIIDRIRKRVAKDKYNKPDELDQLLREEIANLLAEYPHQDLENFEIPKQPDGSFPKPYVIMVVGVNGVGKTTTIGKLAYQYKQAGYSVLLGAADTFRAAAVDQLRLWSQRVQIPLIEKGMQADPAAVTFEAVKAGVDLGVDIVIIDTAGRLHNKVNLMNELSKIKQTATKVMPGAPHEILLVLDASTGQNAIQQATEFTKATQVTALALTKLDGTARGGVVIGISEQFRIPVKFIGVGEQLEDLQIFNRQAFVDSLFPKSAQ
ncbi:MAG: signal recognition particle-docking protein FtsY [Sphingobacteriia bacterium]|nr:signal recognition particle-docking protein FtsY [Sphingobacteriia bacterium]